MRAFQLIQLIQLMRSIYFSYPKAIPPGPAAPVIVPIANELIIAQIAEMEQSDLTNRGSRELMLRLMEKEGTEKGLNVNQLSAAEL
jgi:hypothetical protein